MKKRKTGILLIIIGCFIVTLGCYESHKSTVNHFSQSIDHNNQATRIINKKSPYITLGDMNKIIELKKKALEEAQLVNIEKLNQRYRDFGNHFKDEYMKGIELFIEGIENENAEKSMLGQVLEDKWGSWYEQNIERIKKGK